MDWTDPNPLDINYAAGATGWGSDGYWEMVCVAPPEPETP